MTVTTDDFVALAVRVAHAEARIANLEGTSAPRRGRAPRSSEDLLTEADELRAHLTVCGPQPRHGIVRAYGRDVVEHAIDHRFIHVYTADDGRRLLSAEPAADAMLRRIGRALEEAPGGALSMTAIRALRGVNKNTVTHLLDKAIHDGLLRRGSVATGRAGRRQVIIARADRPLPIHWDTHKVDWDRA